MNLLDEPDRNGVRRIDISPLSLSQFFTDRLSFMIWNDNDNKEPKRLQYGYLREEDTLREKIRVHKRVSLSR